MKVEINSYVKRDSNSGEFISGTVHFMSLVSNTEHEKIPDGLKVNLSKSGNPQCDTPIKHLHLHNGHAGNFNSKALMDTYIRRVRGDIVSVVNRYNMEQEEMTSEPNKLDYALVEENPDLFHVPPPIMPPGMVVFGLDNYEDMQEFFKDMFNEDGDEIDG